MDRHAANIERRERAPPLPVPTIGDMMSVDPGWFWATCGGKGCMRRVPMRYADFAAHWGTDASTDMIRRKLRCSACGHLGVATYHPCWIGLGTGWEPWPAGR